MPTFGYVEYEHASPEVKVVYDDIMATRKVDWISNFWKSLAHDPKLLARTWHSLKDVMSGGTLDSLTKELIYLAVSASNQCHYCISSHTAASWKAGMNGAMFAEVMGIVGMANETNKLVSAYQVEVDERFQPKPEGWPNYASPREVVERYLDCVHCFDIPRLMTFVDPEVRAFDGSELVPFAQVTAYWGALKEGVSGFRIEPEQWIVSGEWVSIVNTAKGRHTGVLFGMPASNVDFEVRGMAAFRVVKGKLVEVHSQWDMGSLMRQVAGANAAPFRTPQA